MAKKSKGGKLGNTFSAPELLSPLNAPRAGAEPGPDVANSPVINPPDPLGYIPGGSKKG